MALACWNHLLFKEDRVSRVILVTHRSHGGLESVKISMGKSGSEDKKVDSSLKRPPPKLSRPLLKPPFLPCIFFVEIFKGPLCCLTDLDVAQWWILVSLGALLLYRMVVDVSAGGQSVMRTGNLRVQKIISEQGALSDLPSRSPKTLKETC